MKRSVFSLSVLLVMLFAFAVAAPGQGRAKTGPDPGTIRDTELEKDSLHNLEVARHYFKLKKAYFAALRRCEEIDAGYPNFSKMDEVLYIAGQSSLRLAETGGVQKAKNTLPNAMQVREKKELKYKTPDELRADARMYLSRLVAEYPNSAFHRQAMTDLQMLGGPIVPSSVEPSPVKPPQ